MSALKKLMVLGVLVAAGAAWPAAASADSSSCPTWGAIDGYAAYQHVLVTAHQPAPDQVRVCYRLKGVDGKLYAGGAVLVEGPGVEVRLPSADTNSDACTTTAGNQTPGPHPMVNGTAFGQRVMVDEWGGPTDAWLCLQVGNERMRVIIRGQGVTPPQVTHEPDPQNYEQRYVPPATYPSGQCTSMGSEGFLNFNVGGVRLYAIPLANNQGYDLCVRGQLVGGKLTVRYADVDAQPYYSVREDIAACEGFIDFTAPERLFIGRGSTGMIHGVCVQVGSTARSIVVGASPTITPPVVTWTPDPDSIWPSLAACQVSAVTGDICDELGF